MIKAKSIFNISWYHWFWILPLVSFQVTGLVLFSCIGLFNFVGVWNSIVLVLIIFSSLYLTFCLWKLLLNNQIKTIAEWFKIIGAVLYFNLVFIYLFSFPSDFGLNFLIEEYVPVPAGLERGVKNLPQEAIQQNISFLPEIISRVKIPQNFREIVSVIITFVSGVAFDRAILYGLRKIPFVNHIFNKFSKKK